MQRYTLLCQKDIETHRKKQLGFKPQEDLRAGLPLMYRKLRKERGRGPGSETYMKYVEICNSQHEQLKQLTDISKRMSNYKEVQKSPELCAKFYSERKVHHETGARTGKDGRAIQSGHTPLSPNSSVRSKSRSKFSPASRKDSAGSPASGNNRGRTSSVKRANPAQKFAIKQKVVV